MENQKGILIKCHGMYYYKTEASKGTRPYDYDVRAPSLEFFTEKATKYTGTDDAGKPKYVERSFINIRGQLKKRLLPILLAKKYPEFARVKYVVIDEVISEDNKNLDLPVTLRSRKQLAVLVKEGQMPIDAGDYLDIDTLRTDILEYQNDPESFLRDKQRRDKMRSEERSFIEMNDLQETLPPQRKPAGIAALE